MKTSNNYPSFSKAFLLLLLLVFLQIVFGIIASVITRMMDLQIPIGEPTIIAVGNLLSLSIIIVWGRKKREEDCEIFYQLKSFKPRFFFPLILLALGLMIVLSECANLVVYYFPPPQYLNTLFFNLFSGGLVSFIAAGVIGPFLEEVLFRGLILRGFLARYNTKRAIVLSSLLFAVFHLNIYQLLPAFILGIFLSWVFIKLNSLWPCIFFHAFYNSIFVVTSTLVRLEAPGFPTEEEVLNGLVQFQPLWFDILGLVLLASGIYYFTRMTIISSRRAI